MKDIIIISREDIEDLERGREIECKMNDGRTVYLMNDETYAKQSKDSDYPEWAPLSQNKPYSYRDELVKQIKEAGRELIERAEDMVSKNTDTVTDFDISISFLGSMDVPEISWTTNALVKNTIKRKY